MNGSIIHQLGCPHKELQLVQPLSDESNQDEENLSYRTCVDRRCCVWQDLNTWFGVKSQELKPDDFRSVFTDVAHGGSGLYEKFIVLGQKTLQCFSEAYIKKQFDPSGIPPDLLNNTLVPYEVCQAVWTLKRVERLLSPESFVTFAKSYLSAAQSLPTEISCIKYVKACIGYSSHLLDNEDQTNPECFEWLPCLVEHMFWISHLNIETHDEDNDMLQDIQEYFGYRYKKLIPRIREVLSTSYMLSDFEQPSGEAIIRYYAYEYFTSLCEERAIKENIRDSWIKHQVEQFMDCPAQRLFASCWLNLSPYFALHDNLIHLPNSKEYLRMCRLLISSCYALSSEEDAQVWALSLIHRLRQIQLLIHLSSNEDGHEVAFNDVDTPLSKEAATTSPLKKPTEKSIRVSDAERDKEGIIPYKADELSVKAAAPCKHQYITKTDQEPKAMNFLKVLGGFLTTCLSSRNPLPTQPLRVIGNKNMEETLELKPLCAMPQIGYLNHLKENTNQTKSQNAFPLPEKNIGQNKMNEDKRSEKEVKPHRLGDIPQANTGPVFLVFGRNMPNRSKQKFNEAGKTSINKKPNRSLWKSCCQNLWTGTSLDRDGVKLWRPPGAIFMQERVQHRNSSMMDKSWNKTIDSNPTIKTTDNSTDIVYKAYPYAASQSTQENLTDDGSSTSGDDDDIKFKIRYILPNDKEGRRQHKPPLDITLHSSKDSQTQSPNRLLRAVVEFKPQDKIDGQIEPRVSQDLRTTIYPTIDDSISEEPICLDFIASGPTGSPRVYVSHKKRSNNKNGTYSNHVTSDRTSTTYSKNSVLTDSDETALENNIMESESDGEFCESLQTETTIASYDDRVNRFKLRDQYRCACMANQHCDICCAQQSLMQKQNNFLNPTHEIPVWNNLKSCRTQVEIASCCSSLYSSQGTTQETVFSSRPFTQTTVSDDKSFYIGSSTFFSEPSSLLSNMNATQNANYYREERTTTQQSPLLSSSGASGKALYATSSPSYELSQFALSRPFESAQDISPRRALSSTSRKEVYGKNDRVPVNRSRPRPRAVSLEQREPSLVDINTSKMLTGRKNPKSFSCESICESSNGRRRSVTNTLLSKSLTKSLPSTCLKLPSSSRLQESLKISSTTSSMIVSQTPPKGFPPKYSQRDCGLFPENELPKTSQLPYKSVLEASKSKDALSFSLSSTSKCPARVSRTDSHPICKDLSKASCRLIPDKGSYTKSQASHETSHEHSYDATSETSFTTSYGETSETMSESTLETTSETTLETTSENASETTSETISQRTSEMSSDNTYESSLEAPIKKRSKKAYRRKGRTSSSISSKVTSGSTFSNTFTDTDTTSLTATLDSLLERVSNTIFLTSSVEKLYGSASGSSSATTPITSYSTLSEPCSTTQSKAYSRECSAMDSTSNSEATFGNRSVIASNSYSGIISSGSSGRKSSGHSRTISSDSSGESYSTRYTTHSASCSQKNLPCCSRTNSDSGSRINSNSCSRINSNSCSRTNSDSCCRINSNSCSRTNSDSCSRTNSDSCSRTNSDSCSRTNSDSCSRTNSDSCSRTNSDSCSRTNSHSYSGVNSNSASSRVLSDYSSTRSNLESQTKSVCFSDASSTSPNRSSCNSLPTNALCSSNECEASSRSGTTCTFISSENSDISSKTTYRKSSGGQSEISNQEQSFEKNLTGEYERENSNNINQMAGKCIPKPKENSQAASFNIEFSSETNNLYPFHYKDPKCDAYGKNGHSSETNFFKEHLMPTRRTISLDGRCSNSSPSLRHHRKRISSKNVANPAATFRRKFSCPQHEDPYRLPTSVRKAADETAFMGLRAIRHRFPPVIVTR